MNALAADQAKRIAAAIDKHESLHGVRSGIYADAEPRTATHEMGHGDVITSRDAMRRDPPDILLTNYKMLDYLLLRGRDRPLWAKNMPETLRFLVVDEMHSFDGAQGADLALLIRRLKSRLSTPAGHLACVGSSATLGSGEDAARQLIAYAENIFGEAFDPEAVVREDRMGASEIFETPDYLELPDPELLRAALSKAEGLNQADAALELTRCLFPDLDPLSEDFDSELPGEPSAAEWRIALGDNLMKHVAAQRVLTIISETKGPASLEAIRDGFSKSKAFRGWGEGELGDLAETVVSLVAWAREGDPRRPQPKLNVRIQFWAREMARMVADLPERGAGGRLENIRLLHSDDLTQEETKRVLPVVHCGRCGTAGHLARRGDTNGDLWSPIETLYEEFFGTSQRLRIIYHERVSRVRGETSAGPLLSGFVDRNSLTFKVKDHSDEDVSESQVPVWLFDPTDDNGRIDRTCPACGTPQSLQIFGLRAARLTAALANTLYTSEQNEVEADIKPRFLLFSDSVQDAAQRAAVAEIRNSAAVIRKSLYKAVSASTVGGLTLKELIEDVPKALCHELGAETFVARFVARDQTWREVYKELCRSGQLIDADRFIDHVRLRLGWEYFSDLTYRSHTSQTLEAARLAVAEVFPDLVQAVAEKLPISLEAHVSSQLKIDVLTAQRFLTGLLQQMRRRGAIGHDYLRLAMETRKSKGANYFAAATILGVGKTHALPFPNHRKASAPLPPTLRSGLEGYEFVLRDNAANWYRDWADRFFVPVYPLAPSLYPAIFQKSFELLEAHSIVRRVSSEVSGQDYAFLIEPETVVVSDRVMHLRCDHCRREEIALSEDPTRVGSPCPRIGCPGHLTQVLKAHGNSHMLGLMSGDRNHRVVAREHTGILDSDDRRDLERKFIEQEEAWTPNLISATPTLEMGIDIGDLSTLLLCSVPPEAANYVQRIGRTGRRDGNSLNVTIANARPHDLQFWEEPGSMLLGEVSAPGVHLEALAVLRRQVAAFTLDRLVATLATAGEYGKVRDALKSVAGEGNGFPLDWFSFIEENGSALATDFLALLPAHISARTHIVESIRHYMIGGDNETLVWQVQSAFGEARREKDELQRLLKELDALQKKLKKQSPPPMDLDNRIDDIKRDKGEIRHSIKAGIDDVEVLRFLTDRSILPNYAFPEEGVKLKSILARHKEASKPGEEDENGSNLVTREYVRPATAALSELAPFQTFYADGREVTIDRLDLGARDISEWRFCQKCAHVEKEVIAKGQSVCPKCGDDMWQDTGSTHEAVELKTVIAVTSEQKASIRDSDDRQNQQYDRAMFPSYSVSAVEQAWASVNKELATPFGYEFISSGEFRDFNFGERAAAPVGGVIAGGQRHSRPFLICRHCGRVQPRFPKDDNDTGEHQPRCSVHQKEISRDDWEAPIFLMRQFSTEAIRVLIPVIGEADHDDIKSFVAGIELGMRKHFAGKVDHIRNVVVEERIEGQIGVRSLYLYDAVPGGSGYLRQLAEHPDTLKSVIEKAVITLRDCRCVAERKDGCFRCVRSYRSHFGPGEPSRDSALALMESVLQHWEHLKKVDAGVNSSIHDDLVESVLERRFLDALRKTFGPESLRPKLLEGTRRAFQLNVGCNGKASFWTIEAQVQIERRFPGLPRKRVDFLISPASGQKTVPIVVEMDGLAYHADTAAEDLETRLKMIRSRKVRVWSLAWHDLSKEEKGNVPNPLSADRLGPQIAGILGQILADPSFKDIAEHKGHISLLQSGSSFEALIDCLNGNVERFDQSAIVIGRLAIGKGSRPLDNLPRISTVSEDGRLFLDEKPLHGHIADQNLDLYLSAPDSQPQSSLRDILGYRALLKGSLPKPGIDTLQTQALSDAWRGLWRTINFLQDLPGFHVEFEGMDGIGAPVVTDREPDAYDQGWCEAEALADEGFAVIITALKSAGTPPPDLLGWDIMVGDTVIGMVELGWSVAKIGLAEESVEVSGWDIIDINVGIAVAEIVRRVLARIEGSTP